MQQEPFKQVTSGDTAREKLLSGVEQLYVPVSSSLGPRSANTAIARAFGRPAVIHDGVNIARSVLPLEDAEENVGAEIIYDAADKAGDIGDGTTTATVLGREIAHTAHKYVVAGAKPMALREGIEMATDAVVKKLGELAKPLKGNDEILKIATISAQNAEIGGMVAEAYKELGKEGILTVEESRTTESSLELKEGMQFDKGWVSPYFVPRDNRRGEATVKKPYVLVTDYALRDLDPVAQMLIRLIDEQQVKDLVIIADSFSPEVLAFVLKNHLKGAFHALLIQAPSFGEKRVDMLRDIAIVTGATFVTQATGSGLDSVGIEQLGRAGKITSTKNTTLVVEGIGAKEDIQKRIDEIEEQAKNPDLSAFDQEKLKERLARLRSGVGVLTIGAKSEPEMKERKERAIDAIAAARAALSDGIVPGGGTALIAAAQDARKELESNKRYQAVDDVRFGADLVLKACHAPFNKLLTNAGFDPGYYAAKLETAERGKGVDVMDGEIVDMIEAGIIDPVLVVKSALGYASSAAVMIVTSDNVVTPVPKEQ